MAVYQPRKNAAALGHGSDGHADFHAFRRAGSPRHGEWCGSQCFLFL